GEDAGGEADLVDDPAALDDSDDTTVEGVRYPDRTAAVETDAIGGDGSSAHGCLDGVAWQFRAEACPRALIRQRAIGSDVEGGQAVPHGFRNHERVVGSDHHAVREEQVVRLHGEGPVG